MQLFFNSYAGGYDMILYENYGKFPDLLIGGKVKCNE